MRYVIVFLFILFFIHQSFAGKKRPRIIGQKPLTTVEGKPITIKLSDLIVVEDDEDKDDDDNDEDDEDEDEDEDGRYPTGYRLLVYSGENYTFEQNTVTPRAGFVGILSVPVRVAKGDNESKKYHLQIQVLQFTEPNARPVITGQSGISILEGSSLTILFSHLVVQDRDNNYPGDFSMRLSAGNNYTVSGRTITPSSGFTGTLSIPVTVHDGTSESEPFVLKVQVVQAGSLEIIGQQPILINEDETVTLKLTDLTVNDPSSKYPNGFVLQIDPGENYTINGQTVAPAKDFYGNLSVTVKVTGNGRSSEPFKILVVVNPVNDAPVIAEETVGPLIYASGSVTRILPLAEVSDADDDQLLYAEVFFDPETYQAGGDQLVFPGHQIIRGLYDSQNGILSLIGNASLAQYQEAIRSIGYTFTMSDTISPVANKTISVVLNDGESLSREYSKTIMLSENVMLDIPNAFTPNSDNANDTWKIKPLGDFSYNSASVKVYSHSGKLIYEASNLTKEWDGTLNGQILPPNAYFYTIELDLSYKKLSYKGVVSLIR
jgi:gliding motility-associated-like protein